MVVACRSSLRSSGRGGWARKAAIARLAAMFEAPPQVEETAKPVSPGWGSPKQTKGNTSPTWPPCMKRLMQWRRQPSPSAQGGDHQNRPKVTHVAHLAAMYEAPHAVEETAKPASPELGSPKQTKGNTSPTWPPYLKRLLRWRRQPSPPTRVGVHQAKPKVTHRPPGLLI
jgi:hypothetical protein